MEARHQLELLHSLTKNLSGDLSDTVQRCQQLHAEQAVLLTRLAAAQHGCARRPPPALPAAAEPRPRRRSLAPQAAPDRSRPRPRSLDGIKQLALQQLHQSRRSSFDSGSGPGAAGTPQGAGSATPAASAVQGDAACALLPSMLAVPRPPSPRVVEGLPGVASVGAWLSDKAAPAAKEQGAPQQAPPQAQLQASTSAAAEAQAGPSAAAQAKEPAPALGVPVPEPLPAAAGADEVVELNVRGSILTTQRSTLVQVPGSRLAALFGGAGASAGSQQQPQQLLLDSQGRPFLPYDPVCFEAVLDGLHELQQQRQAQPLALPPGWQHKQRALQALLAQLGLQQALPLASAPAAVPPAGPWSSLLQRSASLQQLGHMPRSASAASMGGLQANGLPAGAPPPGVIVPNLYALLAAKQSHETLPPEYRGV